MGIQRLQPQAGGGIDWSKYTPISKEFLFTNSATVSTYNTAYSVSGKGYIDKIISVVSGSNHGIKITVDGTVKLHVNGTDCPLGLALEEYFFGSTAMAIGASGLVKTIVSDSLRELGFIDSTTADTKGIITLSKPLFFNSSLLIETRHVNASTASRISIKGGLE